MIEFLSSILPNLAKHEVAYVVRTRNASDEGSQENANVWLTLRGREGYDNLMQSVLSDETIRDYSVEKMSKKDYQKMQVHEVIGRLVNVLFAGQELQGMDGRSLGRP